MSEKLKPCPFCGELPELNMMNIYGKTGSSVKYSYTCSNCGLLMIEWDKEKLIKTWNTRCEYETVKQWINVKDKLPEDMGRYSVYGNCTNDGKMEDIAYFVTSIGNSGYFQKANQPTHWKPLSKPPEPS